MTTKRATLAVLLLAIATVPIIPVGLSHPGFGDAVMVDGRLEAEDYDSSYWCSDGTGGHVQPESDEGSSGGYLARMTDIACTLVFDSIAFGTAGEFQSIRILKEPTADAYVAMVWILVDDEMVARTRIDMAATAPTPHVADFDSTSLISAGTHKVEIIYSPMAPLWANDLVVDYIEGVFDGSVTCSNNRPTAPSPATSDGMDSGSAGWVGRSYDFAGIEDATDPDGDPISYSWRIAFGGAGPADIYGGFQAAGASPLEHAISEPGSYVVAFLATDDPSGRCPGATPWSSYDYLWFMVFDEAEPELFSPYGGVQSCTAGSLGFRVGPNLIEGPCEFHAHFDTDDDGPWWEDFWVSRSHAEFRLDGETFVVVEDDIYPYITYNSADHSMGTYVFDVCFSVPDDKYGLEFCTEPLEFFNVGMPE